ncbi:MAG: glycine oxidase ThiO [Solirubrobacterales bacterium]|nr:glycine oxidase ThiO [Solirubrobacterales bacterium]
MRNRIQAPIDVAVIGGGVIGLAVAWRARQRGFTVTVLERGELGGGSTRVAAGMLAPIAEADPSEAALLELGLASLRSYPSFIEQLTRASGREAGYLRCGTLLVARDRDEAESLSRELEMRTSLGLPVQRLRASEARGLEPGLAPTIRLALLVADDHAIDPRTLTAALGGALARAGGELRTGAEVRELELSDGGEDAHRVVLAGGERISARRVVIAAGVWSAEIEGIPDHCRVPVRPVKGQIMRLRDPAGPALLTRVIRMAAGYIVPRGDGRYVLGATMEERGFDTTVTAGAVFELLRDAIELVPGFSELVIEELSAGLRPGTPDNCPVIGESEISGLYWATGHHRNGILLAPITAELLVGELAGEQPSELAAGFAPGRFAHAAAESAP